MERFLSMLVYGIGSPYQGGILQDASLARQVCTDLTKRNDTLTNSARQALSGKGRSINVAGSPNRFATGSALH